MADPTGTGPEKPETFFDFIKREGDVVSVDLAAARRAAEDTAGAVVGTVKGVAQDVLRRATELDEYLQRKVREASHEVRTARTADEIRTRHAGQTRVCTECSGTMTWREDRFICACGAIIVPPVGPKPVS